MSLSIGTGLDLPTEAVTQTFAILAKRGVGKTYTASVMVEEMLKANLHVVVVDPIGVWWGLRSSADGKHEGLPIVIAGGEHADVPIEPTSGEVLAELIVEQHLSIVIDISLFRKHEQHKFMTAFAETLYRKNRQALHLVLDEADEFAPQRSLGDEARMLGAIEDLVRRGRARGIGVTMITQRPAVLNKNVLTQIEVLVALRLTSPQDRVAIAEWVKYHADAAEAQQMLESLGSLPVGTAWFWSPGWLGLFKKVAVRKRETLDSSSTPKVGERVVAPQKMAAVDLAKIRDQLATTIEKVESEDPKVLRKKIHELGLQLAKQEPQVIKQRVEVVPDELRTCIDRVLNAIDSLDKYAVLLRKYLPEKEWPQPIEIAEAEITEIQQTFRGEPVVAEEVRPEVNVPGGPLAITSYAKGLLDVFAQRWPMQLTRYQISTLSGRKPRSSAFSGAMSELQNGGFIRRDEGRYELTQQGIDWLHVNPVAKKPTVEDTIKTWRKALPAYEESLFVTLLHNPQGLTRRELAEASGRSITSSGFSGAISSLVRNGLAISRDGTVRLTELFFEEAKT